MNNPGQIESFSIDKASYVPIYIQLKDILKKLIDKNKIRANEKIPSENELSSLFDISRMTVRQAIQELDREGYIYIKKGEGTFVSSAPKTQMLFKLDGFSAEMSKQGFKAHSKILEANAVKSFREHSSAYTGLRQKSDAPVVIIKRIRYLEETPFAIESSYFSHAIGEKLLERITSAQFSIYGYIEHDLRIALNRAERQIEPSLADATISSRLGIAKGSPILIIKGTTYSKNNDPVEYLEGVYRGDKYRLSVEISK